MGGIQIDPKLAEALEGKSPEELQAMAEGVEKARRLGRHAVRSGTHEWEDGELVATSDKYSDIVFDETGTYVSGGGVISREKTVGETGLIVREKIMMISWRKRHQKVTNFQF